jgi:hypothetical protein
MKIVLLLLGFLYMQEGIAQTASGNIETYLNDQITSMPGSGDDDYSPPSNSQLNSWGDMIREIMRENLGAARMLSDHLGYQIIEFTEVNSNPVVTYYVLEESTPSSKYWGTYVFNPSACRSNLVLQSPHPRYDTNTGFEAAFCFKRLSAAAIFLSGTHRCNSFSSSSCSGSTSACSSSSQPYRLSDMAHNEKSIFQKTTEIVAAENEQTIFVQLHGFAKNDTDPYVIMSNGTRETPVIDYIDFLRDGLSDADQSLTFRIAHVDQSWTRLIGFTNTQGRMLNESPNPCNESATSTTGRFIHIEQEKSKLREDSTGWYKMYLALASSFECQMSTSLQSEKIVENVKMYPNPAVGLLNIEGQDIQSIQLMNLQGHVLFAGSYVHQGKVRLHLNKFPGHVFMVVVQAQSGISRRLIYQIP